METAAASCHAEISTALEREGMRVALRNDILPLLVPDMSGTILMQCTLALANANTFIPHDPAYMHVTAHFELILQPCTGQAASSSISKSAEPGLQCSECSSSSRP